MATAPHRARRSRRLMAWVALMIAVVIAGCTTPAPVSIATPTPAVTHAPASAARESSPTAALATQAVAPTALPRIPVTSAIGTAAEPIIVGAYGDVAAYPDLLELHEQWIADLAAASGLRFELRPTLTGDRDAIEALGSGRIHLAEIGPLAFVLGRERGSVEPGAMSVAGDQRGRSIMFVARTDSGLTPGDPPHVFDQLAGRRPCWYEPSPDEPAVAQPLDEYVLPKGLLAHYGVEHGPPVVLRRNARGSALETAVFRGECDFAALRAIPPENYRNYLPGDLSGVTFEQWAREMQILYTTPPLLPGSVVGLSPLLPADIRERLTAALLGTTPPQPIEDARFEPVDESMLGELEAILAAADVELDPFLYRMQQPTVRPTATPRPRRPTATPLPAEAETLVIDLNPQDLWPLVPDESDRPNKRVIMTAIYAELARMDADGKFIPYLAASVPTLDNGLVRFVGSGADERLEVTFELRPNLRWHDGQPLTAADLVFSWNYALSPDWPGERWSNVSRWSPEVYVSTVEAPAPDHVVYRFMSQREVREAAQTGGRIGDPAPYADFATHEGPVVPLDYALVGRHVYPEHLLRDVPPSQLAASDFARQPVYAGPYRVVQSRPNDQPVVLEAFEDFALGKPSIQRVVFGAQYSFGRAEPYFQTPDVLAAAFDAGAIGAQLGFPVVRSREGGDPRAYDRLAEHDAVDVLWAPWNAWETLDFNLDNIHLSDPRVRQAIAHAIDRQAIIDLALAGHGRLMRSYLPDWHPLYAGDEALPEYGYDPERARALLQEAGYNLSHTPATHPERGPLSLRLESMDVAPWSRVALAELIREQLAAITIETTIAFHAWTDFEGQDCTAIRNGRQFDLGLAGWLGAAQRYPVGFVEDALLATSIPTAENGCPLEKANWTGWRNAAADALVARLRDGRLALEQPDAYRQAWAEHQRLWAMDLPSIPLFNVERPVTTSTRLSGVQPSPFAIAQGVEETWNIHAWTWQR